MSSVKENPCKNFAPNVFNKNKCLNCFKSRDTHLKSDKDLSKAKPIFGGWLLLAPIGTDFGNPAQKNRKWQRRWFVLFEHGALRYALDNNETTVAQGTIDMNKCSDVIYAEELTDQKHSLCIRLPDQSYFIRGEHREDIMGWHDQLIGYPQTNKEEQKRLKRLKKRQIDTTPKNPVPVEDFSKKSVNSPHLLRSRNNSTTSVRSPSSEKSELFSPKALSKKNDADLILPAADKPTHTANSNSVPSKLDTSYFTIEKKPTDSSLNKDKADPFILSSEPLQRKISMSTSSLDSTASTNSVSESTDGSQLGSAKKKRFKDYQKSSDVVKSKRPSHQHKDQRKDQEKRNRTRSPPLRDETERVFFRDRKRPAELGETDTSNKENDEPSSALSDSSHCEYSSTLLASPITSPVPTPRDPDRDDKRGRVVTRRSTQTKQGTQFENPSRPSGELRRAKSLDRSVYDPLQASSELLDLKKGWLDMQDNDGQWKKHWFVLTKKELSFYHDSSAEDFSDVSGTIDLGDFVEVREWAVSRNYGYGFQVKTSKKARTFLAMTDGIRKKWMDAIRASCEARQASSEVIAHAASDEEKPKETSDEPVAPKHLFVSIDKSMSDRADRRRARIHQRKKEGRSKTIECVLRTGSPSSALVSGSDGSGADKLEKVGRSDGKARSRTFNPDSLLKDVRSSGASTKSTEDVDAPKRKDDVFASSPIAPITRSSSSIRKSIESEWRKLEKTSVPDDQLPLTPSPISKTASMVKALQSEVDSLKKQMERVHIESLTSSDEYTEADGGQDGFLYQDNDKLESKLQGKVEQQSILIDKLKQELAIAHEKLRKQDSEVRDRDMQLDIAYSESHVLETRHSNLHNELHLERSRREEAEKEHVRTMNTLNKELEESETQLKKTESSHLDAQRKIRELERLIHRQKDHNKEEELLQDHIGILRRQVEEQEDEMRDLQESFEEKCQNQKKLEDRLSETKDVIKNYEEQLHEMRECLQSTDEDVKSLRSNDQREIQRLSKELEEMRSNEKSMKEQVERLIAQSELDEDCNSSLESQLSEEKATNQRLRNLLQEHESEHAINERELAEANAAIEQLTTRLKSSESDIESLQTQCKDLTTENKKAKDQAGKLSQSEQVIRDLRARLSAAEKHLGDIEEIRSRSSSTTESSFRAKLSELEEEMGGTGQMIAARLQSLEPSRRVSDPSLTLEKESSSHKIQRLESALEKKSKELDASEDRFKWCENKMKEMEDREKESESQFTAKLEELRATHAAAAKEHSDKIADLETVWKGSEERLGAIRDCLLVLHKRTSELKSVGDHDSSVARLQTVIDDVLKLSVGDTQLSDTPPRSPSPTGSLADRPWSRVTDDQSRQQHQRAMNRLRELTERLKSSDGRLLSPETAPGSLSSSNTPTLPPTALKLDPATQRPKDLLIPAQSAPDDVSAQIFAKQIGVQALLLAEMAVTLRRSQSSPGLAVNRNQGNFNPRQGSPSPQLTSAEFSDNNVALSGASSSGLLEHVDTLALKLTLEGMLMREISRLKESWLVNRGHTMTHRNLNSGSQPMSEVCSAMVAHAHISYVLQVYNERISRLSLESKQARHRADAVMRKLRELVQACKTKDLNAISNIAVQVDLDSIASPYTEKSPWEQQVDYGTLHGAHSVGSSSSEATSMDQEALFFQHLADDLKCMSADVESLSKLGARLIQADAALQKSLRSSDIGEHASTIAREAIVQAEIVYVSHRLRRDYDEELRKAKEAVTDQSNHLEVLNNKMKQIDDSWAGKLKLVTEEHNAKVTRLVQEVERLELARAEMSDDVEERLTRLSKKHEEELKACDAKHEQEKVGLRKELTRAKSDLKTGTKEYMTEVKNLKEKLERIEVQHRKEIEEAREVCNKETEKMRAIFALNAENLNEKHEKEVRSLKSDYEKELSEAEKEFSEKLASIEAARREEVKGLKDQIRLKEKEHEEARASIDREWMGKCATLKREFDEFLNQEKLKHQMALKSARQDAEADARDKYKQKMANLKKDHEKVLENREILHKEQLEREKEAWAKEYRQQWEAEREVAHSRSSSLTSETDSKEALKARISVLEEQLNSVQGKLENEQHRHDYQAQLNEIKSLCDKSFTAIEESHAMQIDELTASHKRELERLKEEHSAILDTNNEDTRRVIEAMRKHHVDELRALREEVRTGSNRNEQADVVKLKEKIETLSEHLTRKCVELENALERNDKAEDALKSLERENDLLRSKRLAINNEPEIKRLSISTEEDQNATDLYQLQVLLRVKLSEIDYLKQDVTSLNKQMDEALKEIKQLQRKHKNVFEELTISRSKEGMTRREVARCKTLLRRNGIYTKDDSDSDGADENRESSPGGYDFQKSRSQPDFPSTALKPSLSLTSQQSTSSSTSVKRRSSDRSSRHGKL